MNDTLVQPMDNTPVPDNPFDAQTALIRGEIDEALAAEEEVYARIGREAWPSISGDPYFAELAAELEAAQGRTAAAKGKLEAALEEKAEQERKARAVKEGTVCPACGEEVEPKMKFCPNCGQKLGAPAKVFCPECGAEVQPGAVFCGECGHRVIV